MQVVLNAELCANKHLLKKGSSIELQVSKSQDVKDVASQPEGSNASLVSKDVPGAVSKGFRVEFIKSFLDGKLKASDGMSSDSASGKVNHDFGLGIGYANIGLNSPGFISRLIFTQYDNQSNSIRIDGNGTYGVTENIYFLGGFNLHKFTKGGDGLDLGFGFQVGVGFQVNQNFGLGLSYVTLNNHGKLNGIDLDFEAKGLELNLHGTF